MKKGARKYPTVPSKLGNQAVNKFEFSGLEIL